MTVVIKRGLRRNPRPVFGGGGGAGGLTGAFTAFSEIESAGNVGNLYQRTTDNRVYKVINVNSYVAAVPIGFADDITNLWTLDGTTLPNTVDTDWIETSSNGGSVSIDGGTHILCDAWQGNAYTASFYLSGANAPPVLGSLTGLYARADVRFDNNQFSVADSLHGIAYRPNLEYYVGLQATSSTAEPLKAMGSAGDQVFTQSLSTETTIEMIVLPDTNLGKNAYMYALADGGIAPAIFSDGAGWSATAAGGVFYFGDQANQAGRARSYWRNIVVSWG